jgi:hypothetical protein
MKCNEVLSPTNTEIIRDVPEAERKTVLKSLAEVFNSYNIHGQTVKEPKLSVIKIKSDDKPVLFVVLTGDHRPEDIDFLRETDTELHIFDQTKIHPTDPDQIIRYDGHGVIASETMTNHRCSSFSEKAPLYKWGGKTRTVAVDECLRAAQNLPTPDFSIALFDFGGWSKESYLSVGAINISTKPQTEPSIYF